MIKSVCGYCGVGCGIEYNDGKLMGDVLHTSNSGNLCAKGSSQLLSIRGSARLEKPLIREKITDEFINSTYDECINAIAQKIKQTKKEKIAFYLSGQMLTEDYYIANKLGKGFLNTNNVDTNSRTCMSSAVVAYKKALGADFVPLRMEDINKADLLILAGSNAAESHVVLHNRIKKAAKNGLKVVVIDPRFTDTAKSATLHLPIKVGSDIEFFNLISKRLIEENLFDASFVEEHINGFDELKSALATQDGDVMLAKTGLGRELFEEFFLLYKTSLNIITAWTMGLNQSSQGVDKNLALINTHLLSGKIFKEGNGPLSLTGQPNAMGGREVGGLSTMLAVHLGFDDESIKKVEDFWQTSGISNKAGLTATQMISDNIDVLIVCHTDPVYHLPNRNKVESIIKNIPLVVEINAYEDSQTANFAHIRLPALPWGEKEGVQTNMDRTMTKQSKLGRNFHNIKADWEIFQMLAQKLGFQKAFNYHSSKEIFDEYRAMTKLNGYMDISKTSYEQLASRQFVWGEDIKRFLTPDAKGNLFVVNNGNLSEMPSAKFPFLLLTGRTRDQWHSGTKSAGVASLLKYKPLEYCEINPSDAQKMFISSGDSIKISSCRGEVVSVAMVSSSVQEGVLFVPISQRGVNYLTSDILDPLSLQPDYNHSAVRIDKL